ncbi:MAG: ECF transporter S component [Lachnospiraceae bacterium]|jgi:uncharacterized membrane protein|nr:ECF transporter S component [Lachnospiraceae bacterium]MCR5702535.1 ECF transporter S component [Lachnospiraceae bacterium]
MKQNINTQKITITALFAAIICVATFFIKIPIPATNGYIHPGDGFVVLSGALLGPVFGAVASGIGGATADLLGGYALYAPVTFLVKALMAFSVGKILEIFKTQKDHEKTGAVIGAVISVIINVGGYFFYELILYGKAAFVSVPWNVVQGISGVVIFFALYPTVKKVYLNRR